MKLKKMKQKTKLKNNLKMNYKLIIRNDDLKQNISNFELCIEV